MTPDQKMLARRALGLPNQAKVSYRNHYLCDDLIETMEWNAMVAAGEAKGEPIEVRQKGAPVFFWLTRKGAEDALEPDETLCPEGFPPRNSDKILALGTGGNV